MIDKIYYWIGFVVLWCCVFYGIVNILWFMLTTLMDELGKKFKILWVMFEFTYYKEEFKEWVKDKKRHPNAVK